MTVAAEEADLELSRAALALAMRRFPKDVRFEQFCLFREYLALNVCFASPLVAIIAAHESLDVSDMALHLRPPWDWPQRSLSNARLAGQRATWDPFNFSPGAMVRRHRRAGVLIGGAPGTEDSIGLRVVSDTLEICASVGGVKVESDAGRGRLRLEHPIAETLSIALIGRPVTALVAHPWFDAMDWPVVEIIGSPTHTAVVFDTGQSPWRMPWQVLFQQGKARR